MDHVAIMKKSLGFLPKIISGEKTIESRFYNSKRAPWGRVQSGDRIFFKNSGESVTVVAEVSKVLYENPDKYISLICLEKLPEKKYPILIFLKDVKLIKPFNVSKKGFGAMTAWITVDNIDKIKI